MMFFFSLKRGSRVQRYDSRGFAMYGHAVEPHPVGVGEDVLRVTMSQEQAEELHCWLSKRLYGVRMERAEV